MTDSDFTNPAFPLPAMQPEPATPSRSTPEGGDGEDAVEATPSRILIVDDNESNRDLLARRLKNHHFEMAADGAEALEKVRAQPFDVVLLDIMMPGIDGYEVLRQMKADENLKHIPVIMISALSEMNSVVRCIEMGAEDYLSKPFSPTLLRARLGACLERKRAHDREAQLFAQLQENYARLRRLEQQRDDFTHMIVHDLRSPLSANIAGIEMVEILGPLGAEQRECLIIALRSGQSLLELINDLLDISKMEAGAIKMEVVPCETAASIAAAADQITPLLIDRQLELSCEVSSDLPPVLANENILRRILINLLSNAIKFAPREGTISLNAREQDGEVLFSVHDTGEGIPESALQQIFEKFAQVNNSSNERQGSTGLGLTFCKLAVEGHNGRIWAESTPGKGSSFFFTLPIAASATDAAP